MGTTPEVHRCYQTSMRLHKDGIQRRSPQLQDLEPDLRGGYFVEQDHTKAGVMARLNIQGPVTAEKVQAAVLPHLYKIFMEASGQVQAIFPQVSLDTLLMTLDRQNWDLQATIQQACDHYLT